MSKKRAEICHYSLVGEYAKKVWIRSSRGKYWTLGANHLLVVQNSNETNDSNRNNPPKNYNKFYVHPMILACYGLLNIIKSKNEGNNESPFVSVVQEIDICLVEHCYVANIPLKIRNLAEIYLASSRMGCLTLYKIAKAAMDCALREENIFSTLKSAIQSDAKRMQEICYKNIKPIILQGVRDEQLKLINDESLFYVCSKDDLPIKNEMQVALLILKWINQKKKEKSSTFINYSDLINIIRWPFIEIEDLFKILEIVGPKFYNNPTLMKPIMKAHWLKAAGHYLKVGDEEVKKVIEPQSIKPRLWREKR